MMNINEIGVVKSRFTEPTNPTEMKKHESTIIIKEEFIDGLFKIEDSEFIDVVFGFHKSKGYDLKTITFTGELKGVFASRSPRRPTSIGITTVNLLERKGNELKVKGLDAINGTPVIDIKPYVKKFDIIIDELEPGNLRLPVLLKKYVKQNAKLIAFNVDPKFNNAVDGLMYLRIADLPESTVKPVMEEFQAELERKLNTNN